MCTSSPSRRTAPGVFMPVMDPADPCGFLSDELGRALDVRNLKMSRAEYEHQSAQGCHSQVLMTTLVCFSTRTLPRRVSHPNLRSLACSPWHLLLRSRQASPALQDRRPPALDQLTVQGARSPVTAGAPQRMRGPGTARGMMRRQIWHAD